MGPSMIDDVSRGILSGLFGPTITRWASKFRYRAIFLVTVISVYVFAFVSIVLGNGWHKAFETFVDRTRSPVGFLVPISIGLLVVACAFVWAIGMPDKKK